MSDTAKYLNQESRYWKQKAALKGIRNAAGIIVIGFILIFSCMVITFFLSGDSVKEMLIIAGIFGFPCIVTGLWRIFHLTKAV